MLCGFVEDTPRLITLNRAVAFAGWEQMRCRLFAFQSIQLLFNGLACRVAYGKVFRHACLLFRDSDTFYELAVILRYVLDL